LGCHWSDIGYCHLLCRSSKYLLGSLFY
jgi:hypothetical protein